MSDTKLAYFNNAPPEQWSILGYYQFRRQQSDFSGIFRWENGLLKKALEAIIRNSENDFKVERAQGMLNNLKWRVDDFPRLGRTPLSCLVDDL
ncbi:hypothetical protein BC938DRAFT_474682 [Jimgerdemannia flammicorona]|uniref:Uncharacterized protein n=1 Tax=Jimgerdemannia flammicorona TaxID=994334 RepID=A0A433QZK8_9FUNG|nr:hypothetical protein BC938DRAFT_474682 [Jimgerdemannia flammicorona]